MNADDGLALVAGSLQGNVAPAPVPADRQRDPAASRAGLNQACGAPVAGDGRAVNRPDDVPALELPRRGQAADRARDRVVRRERDAELAERRSLRRLLRARHLLGVLLRHLLLAFPWREELLLRHDRLMR